MVGSEVNRTIVYGWKLSNIIYHAWNVMVYGYMGHRSGKYNRTYIRSEITAYDAAWRDYNATLKSDPLFASPFYDYYEGGHLNDQREPGLGASIDLFRKL